MRYDPHKHHRRSIRLKGYNYASSGAYFITLCTYQRQHLFGKISNGRMEPSQFGEIAATCWQEIPSHFPQTQLDAFVVMPDHFHGILWITNDANDPTDAYSLDSKGRAVPCPNDYPAYPNDYPAYSDDRLPRQSFGKLIPHSLPTIIGSFKSVVTKRINLTRNAPGTPVWQRNYYEQIIRDQTALHNIRQYISNNPKAWRSK